MIMHEPRSDAHTRDGLEHRQAVDPHRAEQYHRQSADQAQKDGGSEEVDIVREEQDEIYPAEIEFGDCLVGVIRFFRGAPPVGRESEVMRHGSASACEGSVLTIAPHARDEDHASCRWSRRV